MTTYISNDNLNSIAFIKRPHENQSLKKNNYQFSNESQITNNNQNQLNSQYKSPFISTIPPRLTPIGQSSSSYKKFMRVKNRNQVEENNKNIIKHIEKVRNRIIQREKQEEIKVLNQLYNIKTKRNQVNDEIEKQRKTKNEFIGNLSKRLRRGNEECNKEKLPLEKKDQILVDNDNDENLINFGKQLDFDEYMKDLEIKEALKLIQAQIENEKKEEKVNEVHVKDEERVRDEIKENKEELPIIENNRRIIENTDGDAEKEKEKEWDVSKNINKQLYSQEKYTKEEIEDYDKQALILKNILKMNENIKKVHSRLSLKKLIEREGGFPYVYPKIYENKETYNIHNFNSEGKYKIGLIANVIQNPDVYL